MADVKKILPFIIFGLVGLIVCVLCIVSLVIPWYSIQSSDNQGWCTATTIQSWDTETVTSTGPNCTNLNFGTRQWRDTCDVDFCKNKAVIFVVTRGLLAYATVGTFVALVVYLVGAFAPGKAFQIHATGAAIFAVGLCSLLPIALAVFLFGIGLTSAVLQDQTDYVARVTNNPNADPTNTNCQLAVSCPDFAGSASVTDPCSLAPFGCYADPLASPTGVTVSYTWASGPGFPVSIIAGILALATVPTMAIWGLRKEKKSLLGDESGEEAEAPLKSKGSSRDLNKDDDDDE